MLLPQLALLLSMSLTTEEAPMHQSLMTLPPAPAATAARSDWLVRPPDAGSRAYRTTDGKGIVLDNGLIRRVWRLAPNAATVEIQNLTSGESMVRAVMPEGWVVLDGKRYDIGGLVGQPDRAYLLPEWLEAMKADTGAFAYERFRVGPVEARMAWKRVRHSADSPWPPRGVELALHFGPPAGAPNLRIEARYEVYDGLPVVAKRLVLRNEGSTPVRLNRFASETLALTEAESAVGSQAVWTLPGVHVASDYMFGGDTPENANRVGSWVPDPAYTTQVNYELAMPAILECKPPIGPDVEIAPGGTFETFRTFLLFHDATDRERRGLAVRRLYRALAPWSTENPLMLHLTSTDPATVRTAIDQCADVGFEMVIFSFGSGLNMEDTSPGNIARFREFADYAHGKGIQIGGYSLLASRRISDEHDAINPRTGKPGGAIFGNSPCLGSAWGIAYFDHIRTFLSETGFDLLEHDGSYPGDVCASTSHPGHRGLDDSQWTQFARIAEFYRWCRERGIYLNVPDWYFLAGSNKSGMGYRETNWSLPRAWQHIHSRQNLFDGTWQKTPSMGWMFTPLVEYQGGGANATIEPLKEHLHDYELHLTNNLCFGAQACYRGPRLYDSEETRSLVRKWVGFYKEHRAILESDVLHLRRADGRRLDGIMHVNPILSEKALAVFWNPTREALTEDIVLPLTYAGLDTKASISRDGGRPRTHTLSRKHEARRRITVPPEGMTWLVVR